jgi:hypothetical protein
MEFEQEKFRYLGKNDAELLTTARAARAPVAAQAE